MSNFANLLFNGEDNHFRNDSADQVLARSKQAFVDALKLKMMQVRREGKRYKEIEVELDDDLLLGHDIEYVVLWCEELGVSINYRFGLDKTVLFTFGKCDDNCPIVN